jgi:hypothetical protein
MKPISELAMPFTNIFSGALASEDADEKFSRPKGLEPRWESWQHRVMVSGLCEVTVLNCNSVSKGEKTANGCDENARKRWWWSENRGWQIGR